MELRVLKTFVAVASLKSFSAAARELHTVQPAVSRQIADLESELGVSLFWRTTREVKVTAAGESLLREATDMLEHEARAKALVQRAAQGQVGRLRIGYLASACFTFMPDLVRGYGEAFPDVQITLNEMTAREQIEAFEADQLDVGFSRPLPSTQRLGLVAEPVYMDSLIAALPTSHALAGAASIRLRDLATEPFVAFRRSEATGLFDQVIGACQREKFSPQIVSEPGSMQVVLTEVAAGLGVAVVPGCAANLYAQGCALLPIHGQKPSIPMELHCRAEPRPPAVAAFASQVRQARKTIQSQMAALARPSA